MSENLDRVNPILLTDNKGIIKAPGEVYELDFTRESIAFAEARGFKLENVAEFPVTNISSLFYYSFRKNHKSVPRDRTDKFMEAWGGLPESVLKRLIELYNQAATANNIQTDEDAEKNETATVEM